jgi:hypothetical protein
MVNEGSRSMLGFRRGRLGVSLVIAASLGLGACSGQVGVARSGTAASSGPTPAPSVAMDTAAPTTTTGPEATSAAPSDGEVAGPPAASLAVEGGDPVEGRLGTYLWAGGGSDSPWLPGSPIAVGSSERLTMSFRPAIDVVSWRARYVPSTASDPAGARSLGEGTGPAHFEAPDAGSWTVEVHVDFADGAGNASYFWLVTAN